MEMPNESCPYRLDIDDGKERDGAVAVVDVDVAGVEGWLTGQGSRGPKKGPCQGRVHIGSGPARTSTSTCTKCRFFLSGTTPHYFHDHHDHLLYCCHLTATNLAKAMLIYEE